jgi:hypothetical protein
VTWQSLSPDTERSQFEQAVRQCLSPHGQSSLLWAIRPALWQSRTRMVQPTRRPHMRNLMRSYALRPPLHFAMRDETLIVWGTENQRRVLLTGIRGSTSVPRFHYTPSPTQIGRHIATANEEANDFERLPGVNDLTLDWSWVKYNLGRAALGRAIAERILEQQRPTSIVVATQHAPLIRALLATLRSAKIPTLYVPHAPVADNYEYADLPFDFAGLRGPAEIAHYVALEADESRLSDCGDPSLNGVEMEGPSGPGRLPVFAVSPWSGDEKAWLWETARAGMPSGTIVAPHPRSQPKELSDQLAPGWSIADGVRTVDLLRTSASVLVQSSSGVGLEGLRLGLPLVDFRPPGTEPNYHFLRHPCVDVVRDHQSLRTIMAERNAPSSDAAVQARIAWATQWSSRTGSAASTAIEELVDTIPSRGVQKPLLDRFSM